MPDGDYKILSFDGGGVRGLLSIIVLQRIAKALPGFIDQADLIAGTSTGGIIALGLAHGIDINELRLLYEEKTSMIFHDSWIDNLLDLGTLAGAQYDNSILKEELNRLFDTTTLKELNKHVLIPTFDLDNNSENPVKRGWAPKFFHNFEGADSDGDRLVRDVALYTTAAPTFFPTVDGYIDGGVICSNPSMAAISQTQDRRAFPTPPLLRDVHLLSIGTGTCRSRIEGDTLDWGLAQWMRPLLQILTEGNISVVDYQCRQILGGNYFRVCPDFSAGQVIPLDAVDKIPELIKTAESIDLNTLFIWLAKNWG
ncbi:MAG: patatin-like phospholipase family protein [Verrucomicrobia bacterium]|nr:patatin-like phospholipase family protein [Verrucomicrobiota bacterium]MCF7709312.1 patatin-like phospholipase family protein [Verrucomicrobiota bacterium]